MEWIADGLVTWFFKKIAQLLLFIMNSVESLPLDFGVAAREDMPRKMQAKDLAKQYDTHPLEKVFTNIDDFKQIIFVAAFVLVFVIVISKLFTALWGPLNERAESPLKVMGLGLLAMFLVAYSFSIFDISLGIAGQIYEQFRDLHPIDDAFISTGIMDKDGTFNIGFFSGLGDDYDLVADSSFKAGGDNNNMVQLILGLVFFFMLLWNAAKLCLEMFQRYITLGVLYYTCPLAFSAVASEGTMTIFKNWVSMVMSQFILMCMNIFFLDVFAYGFANVLAPKELDGSIFESNTEFITTMLILAGWLIVGQQVDQYLKTLGMATAQAGAGLASSLIVAGGMAAKALKGTGRTFSSAAKGAAKIPGRVSDAKDVAAAGGSKLDTVRAFAGNTRPGMMHAAQAQKSAAQQQALSKAQTAASSGAPLTSENKKALEPVAAKGDVAKAYAQDAMGINASGIESGASGGSWEKGEGNIVSYSDAKGNTVASYASAAEFSPANGGPMITNDRGIAQVATPSTTAKALDTAKDSLSAQGYTASAVSKDGSALYAYNPETGAAMIATPKSVLNDSASYTGTTMNAGGIVFATSEVTGIGEKNNNWVRKMSDPDIDTLSRKPLAKDEDAHAWKRKDT